MLFISLIRRYVADSWVYRDFGLGLSRFWFWFSPAQRITLVAVPFSTYSLKGSKTYLYHKSILLIVRRMLLGNKKVLVVELRLGRMVFLYK